MIEKQPRIALLIDADNSPASKIDVILAELAKVGVINIRRAYGNWKKDGLKGWEAVLHEYAIRPVQQFDYSKGKNATDMGMVIEAMDLLYTDQPDAFGIVSSDATSRRWSCTCRPRARRSSASARRRRRCPSSTPARASCTWSTWASRRAADEPDKRGQGRATASAAAAPQARRKRPRRRRAGGRQAAPSRQDTAALKQDARLVTLLRNAVESAAGEDGWSALGSVGQQIGNQASFDPRNYGYRKLLDLIEATQLFELDRRGTPVRAARQAPGQGRRRLIAGKDLRASGSIAGRSLIRPGRPHHPRCCNQALRP